MKRMLVCIKYTDAMDGGLVPTLGVDTSYDSIGREEGFGLHWAKS